MAALSQTPPEDTGRDDRKSAAVARNVPQPGAKVVSSFADARDILRSEAMLQGGIGGDVTVDASQQSVFFLDGDLHRQRRAAIARFFTPKAIASRYRAIMESTTEELITELRTDGTARLDTISFQLAVNVAAEIVGLTDSDPIAMAGRIHNTMQNGVGGHDMGPIRRGFHKVLAGWYAVNFYLRDVRPAVQSRRKFPREDVISHLLEEHYSPVAMLLECLTYAGAGMVTTREFIVMAAWHLFENEALRTRFMTGTDEDQVAILEEILRVEPVASMLHRKAEKDASFPRGAARAGELYAVDVRSANMDEAVTGPCPHMIDPNRAKKMRVAGSYMSFGDGRHRCPGAQVALQETRIFLESLLTVPGIRLAQAPELIWQPELMSYELRNAVVTCDRD